MPAPEGERIAALEATVRGLRHDVQELDAEVKRARQRLHDIEGAMAALVTTQTERLRQEGRVSRRLELRLQALSVVVLIAGVIVPLVLAGTGR